MGNESPRGEAPAKVETRSTPVGHAGGKVTVACKLPHGLVLRLYKMVPDRILMPGGTFIETQRAEPLPDQYAVHGMAVAKGEAPGYLIVGGYALTPNIPADFWDAWWKANKDAPYCKNEMIRAYENRPDAIAGSKERADIRSNMEPFAIDGDPRRPRPTVGVSGTTKVNRNEDDMAE